MEDFKIFFGQVLACLALFCFGGMISEFPTVTLLLCFSFHSNSFRFMCSAVVFISACRFYACYSFFRTCLLFFNIVFFRLNFTWSKVNVNWYSAPLPPAMTLCLVLS